MQVPDRVRGTSAVSSELCLNGIGDRKQIGIHVLRQDSQALPFSILPQAERETR